MLLCRDNHHNKTMPFKNAKTPGRHDPFTAQAAKKEQAPATLVTVGAFKEPRAQRRMGASSYSSRA